MANVNDPKVLDQIMSGSDVFSALDSYVPGWKVLNSRKFTNNELAQIQEAEVVVGDHNLAVCFTMISGKKTFISLDGKSKLQYGEKVDPSRVVLKQIQNVGKEGLAHMPIGSVTLRVDVLPEEPVVAATFDNPLGL